MWIIFADGRTDPGIGGNQPLFSRSNIRPPPQKIGGHGATRCHDRGRNGDRAAGLNGKFGAGFPRRAAHQQIDPVRLARNRGAQARNRSLDRFAFTRGQIEIARGRAARCNPLSHQPRQIDQNPALGLGDGQHGLQSAQLQIGVGGFGGQAEA